MASGSGQAGVEVADVAEVAGLAVQRDAISEPGCDRRRSRRRAVVDDLDLHPFRARILREDALDRRLRGDRRSCRRGSSPTRAAARRSPRADRSLRDGGMRAPDRRVSAAAPLPLHHAEATGRYCRSVESNRREPLAGPAEIEPMNRSHRTFHLGENTTEPDRPRDEQADRHRGEPLVPPCRRRRPGSTSSTPPTSTRRAAAKHDRRRPGAVPRRGRRGDQGWLSLEPPGGASSRDRAQLRAAPNRHDRPLVPAPLPSGRSVRGDPGGRLRVRDGGPDQAGRASRR